MAGLLDRIARARRVPFHAMTPLQARDAYPGAAEMLEPPRAPLARVRDLTLPAADGTPLPARPGRGRRQYRRYIGRYLCFA